MDNGNVAEITYLQGAIYLKFGRSPEKLMTRISTSYILFLKFWLKLNERMQQPFHILISGIVQSALNDLKLNLKNQTCKVP